MRLMGSFHTITIHGTSTFVSSRTCGRSISTGAVAPLILPRYRDSRGGSARGLEPLLARRLGRVDAPRSPPGGGEPGHHHDETRDRRVGEHPGEGLRAA